MKKPYVYEQNANLIKLLIEENDDIKTRIHTNKREKKIHGTVTERHKTNGNGIIFGTTG